MGYNTRLQGSGAQPSPFMGYNHPQQPMQQGQLAMPPRPGMSTYSTPGAPQMSQQPMMNAQQGMNPMMNAQQGMTHPAQLANALSRM